MRGPGTEEIVATEGTAAFAAVAGAEIIAAGTANMVGIEGMAPAAKRETTEPEISVEQAQLAVTGRRLAISSCPVAEMQLGRRKYQSCRIERHC